MNKIREILRLSLDGGLSQGAICKAMRVGKGTVRKILEGYAQAGLAWPLPLDLPDSKLQEAIYGPLPARPGPAHPLDLAALERELSRPHVTIQLLYEEYRKANPQGLSRTRFYTHLGAHLKKRELHLRMVRKGGDLLFVDFAGSKLRLHPAAGPEVELQLLITSFGASGKAFATCLPSQGTAHFLQGLTEALAFYKCAPHGLVPDNLKAAVLKSRRNDPQLNVMFERWCAHYGVVPLPARVRRPKDKALVENAVLHLGEFLLGRLRDAHLPDIATAKAALFALVLEFNQRSMQHYKQSRDERFELLDRPFAKPLPEVPFQVLDIATALRVENDYHVRYQGHFFSVPHALRGCCVEAQWRGDVVQFFHDGLRVASHPMPEGPRGAVSTNPHHMPPAHRAIRFPEKEVYLEAGKAVGEAFGRLVEAVLIKAPHAELGRRLALRLLALSRNFGAARAEAGSRLALMLHLSHPRDLEAILSVGADLETDSDASPKPFLHANLRGEKAFTLNTKRKVDD